jgi:hypothetical protein
MDQAFGIFFRPSLEKFQFGGRKDDDSESERVAEKVLTIGNMGSRARRQRDGGTLSYLAPVTWFAVM